MKLLENERIDQVPGTNYRIIQDSKKFSYGTDAIFLSEFSNPKGVVVDLGTGTGIIPIRMWGRKRLEKIYGIEIQEQVADMARRSVHLNDLDDNIEIINMDLKDISTRFKRSVVDAVISNPPYMKYDDGMTNMDENFAISRHEVECDLEDIIKTADYLLAPLGKFYLVHRPDRLVDIFYLLRKYKLEAKYLRLVQSKIKSRPNLLLIEAVKHGKPELKFYDPLIVYNEDGDYTDELKDIYYKEV